MVRHMDRDVPAIEITDEMISSAFARAQLVRLDRTKLNQYTYKSNGEGIELGCLSEILFERQLGYYNIPFAEWSNDNTTVLDYIVRGMRVEIKSKCRTVRPQLNYACTVSDYNFTHQNVDFYYFVSFERDGDGSTGIGGIVWPHCAYLVGASSKQFFKAHSVFLRKGDQDGPNMLIKFDCHNIYIHHTISNWAFIIKVLGGFDDSELYSRGAG